MSFAPVEEQLEVLMRGTVDIHPVDDLRGRLKESRDSNRPLVVKVGFDPTSADLHLGHTVLMEKMAQFQRFGHSVIFLIGDYTALIGDPTGRNAKRPPLTEAQVTTNAATYMEQCFKVLAPERTRVERNSTWLGRLGLKDLIALASRYNLGRMLERRDFKTRYENNRQIAIHELLYPLLQAWDSVELKADIELGGSDQIFNLNVGRQIMEAFGLRPQIVLTVPLLVGRDGVEKMSKSAGNHVGISEPPKEIFGKVMSIDDETMWRWIPLLLGREPDRSDPLLRKKQLAFDLVARFCGHEEARRVLDWWNAGRPPDDTEQAEITIPSASLYKIVCAAGGAKTGGEARRKVLQRAVWLNGEPQEDPIAVVHPGTYVLRVGRRLTARILVEAS